MSSYNLAGIHFNDELNFSGGFMRVYVQFMGIRGTEKKNSLEAQDNLLRISANISRCTTRLNTPVFPIGAGSLEQGHGSTKSREKNNNWAVRVADKMAIRKNRIKEESPWLRVEGRVRGRADPFTKYFSILLQTIGFFSSVCLNPLW